MPVIIAGTMDTYSKTPVDVKLTSHFIVSYCERATPRTEVLVTLGLGDIKKSDSLYGFNFAIKYDRKKLYFNSKITSNTLSEFASYADVSFGLEYGKLFGAGINNTPLSGNKELIGFYGDYIGELCNDSALIEIEYIEFTDEFQRTVNKLDTIWIKPIKNVLTYNIDINLTKDEYIYDSTITNLIPIEFDFSNVKYLDVIGFSVLAENSSYNIDYKNINENFEISELENNSSSIKFLLENKNNISLDGKIKIMDLEIKKNINETDTNSRIFVTPIKLSDCKCFDEKRVSSDSIKIKYVKNNTTSVDDLSQIINVNYLNSYLDVNSNNDLIKKIQLFNSVGNKVFEKEINNYKYMYSYNLPNGVYLCNIWTNKQVLTKKILVNN